MEWELSKENVMPVKAGHNVEILNESLKIKAEGAAQSDVLENQRRHFLQAIKDYAGEDPLDPWIGYIKWVKDAYPAGGAQSQLLNLLEECTRKFQKDERYRCDKRYLQIWVQYADCCSDPSEVFAFLEANNIGQDHALFYEAYATSMEVRRQFSKAEGIYHLGLQRSAQPSGRLENMYKSFLHRMNRRFERRRQENLKIGVDENDSQIRHFGNMASSSGAITGQQNQRPPLPSHTSTRRQERASLQISVDPEFAFIPINAVQDVMTKENKVASYDHLGNDSEMKKENVQQPAKWTKAKISQTVNGQYVHRSDLNIFVDEEFADGASIKSKIPANKNTLQGLRVRLEDMQKVKRQSPSLKGSFLDLQENWASSMADGANKDIAEISKFPIAEAITSRPHPETAFGYDVSILSKNGCEQTFEEARLSVWIEKTSLQVSEMQGDRPARNCEENQISQLSNGKADMSAVIHSSVYRKDSTERLSLESKSVIFGETVDSKTVNLGTTGDQFPDRPGRPATTREEPVDDSQRQSVTVDVRSCAIEKAVTVDATPLNSLTMQGDETVAIKQLVEQAIVLGSDPEVTIDAVSHQGLVEPTITTKQALADILDMFSKPLEVGNPRSKSRKLNDTKRLSSETPVSCSDFEIFVDEDLETRSLASRNKSKARKFSGRHSGDSGIQNDGLHIVADENLGVPEPAKECANLASSSLVDPTAQSHDFHIYSDECLDTQSKQVSKRALKNATDITYSHDRVLQSRDFGSAEGKNEDSCNTESSKDERRKGRTTSKTFNSANGSDSFQVFVDENFRGPAEHSRKGKTKATLAVEYPIDHSALDHTRELLLGSEKQDDNGQKQSFHVQETKEARTDLVISDSAAINYSVTQLPERVATELPSALEKDSPDVQARGRGRRALSKSPAAKSVRRSPRLKAQPSTPTTTSPQKEQVPTAKVLTVSNPWDEKHDQKFLVTLQRDITSYEGFNGYKKKYSGPIPLSSLKGSHVRDKVLKLGASEYHLKACIGQGAFAQVYEVEDEDDDLLGIATRLALKVQRPACPWEFYIYRQLDFRIPSDHRHNYGQVRKFYQYSDCSFMVCNHYDGGTLQDVVNAYLAKGQKMDEVLCMFYAIEMLRMLEILHGAGIIHGDFKPDNLMIRDDSNEMEEWTPDRRGGWRSKGLALIDFGRSIDTTLYPEDAKFQGDCKTDSFRCPEMYENRPWTFQIDTFGLCVVVHCLLHGTYMQIEKFQTANGPLRYRPKSSYKRFWQVELWRTFFEMLINIDNPREHLILSVLRRAFEDHLTEHKLGKKLKALLAKQTIMMYKG